MFDIDKTKAYWASWANGNIKIVPTLIENTPELEPMIHTPQSRSVHAEGSVARHTILSCEAVNEIIEVVPQDQRMILRLAVLLHDIGKPGCIIEAAPGIYSFPDANKRSFRLARLLLEKYTKIPFKEREKILPLIKNHPEPMSLVKKGRPLRDLQRISLECNLQTLYNLTKVNYIGRTAPNLRDKFEELEAFKRWCMNQEYWNTGLWKGVLDLEAYRSFGKNANLAKSIVDWFYLHGKIDDYLDAQDWISHQSNWHWGTLFMTVGPPGCGRSLWVKDNYSIMPVVSSDAIKEEFSANKYDKTYYEAVDKVADERIASHLQKGAQVVYDAPNVSFERRKQVIDMARLLGAGIVIINFTTTYDTCLSRIKGRKNSTVTKEDLDELFLQYDYVSSYECNKLVYV